MKHVGLLHLYADLHKCLSKIGAKSRRSFGSPPGRETRAVTAPRRRTTRLGEQLLRLVAQPRHEPGCATGANGRYNGPDVRTTAKRRHERRQRNAKGP